MNQTSRTVVGEPPEAPLQPDQDRPDPQGPATQEVQVQPRDGHLIDAEMIDQHLLDKHLTDKHVSDPHLSDPHLRDPHLRDQHVIGMPMLGAPALQADALPPATHRPVAEPVDVQPVHLQPVPPHTASGQPMFGLGLIGNVKVKVRAVIGDAELTIAELFALKEGASLKLDVAANAPIDLYLENKLIARGGLVVVDESFGIQITQIEVDHELA